MVASSDGLVAPPVARVAEAALAIVDPTYEPQHEDGPVTRAEQAATLARLAEIGGPAAVLTAGRLVATATRDPIVMVLLNSSSIEVLLEKVERLNRFLHSHHRQRILDQTATGVTIEHYSTRARPPAPIESLFVAGLMASLLGAVGAKGISVTFPRSPRPDPVMVGGEVVGPVPTTGVDLWAFGWNDFSARRTIPGLDEHLAGEVGPDLELPPTVGSVRSVLASDLARRWSIAAVAAKLAMSPRTLQRRLAGEGTRFTAVVDELRLESAQRLLRDRTMSVTEVGYHCGYADSAHFSRSFRAATGLPPSEWRRR